MGQPLEVNCFQMACLRSFHRKMPFDQKTGTLVIIWQVHQILTGSSSCQGISSTCPSNLSIVFEGT